jgi:hypothetical protein
MGPHAGCLLDDAAGPFHFRAFYDGSRTAFLVLMVIESSWRLSGSAVAGLLAKRPWRGGPNG